MRKVPVLILIFIICFGLTAACKTADLPSPLSPPPPVSPSTDSTNNGDVSAEPGPPAGKSERHQLADLYGLPYDTSMDEWEPVTFTYFCVSANQPPPEDNPIIKIVEEITNVKIDFLFYDVDSKLALEAMVTADDMPDMAYFGDGAAAAIDSGHFMPVDELIEQYAPQLRVFYDPWWELMKHKDGRIYTAEINGTLTGTQAVMWQDQYAFWIQKDVLDHFGRAPKDLNEYFDFIREYMELYPEIGELPVTGFLVKTFDERKSGLFDPGYFLAGNANWGEAINTDGNYINAGISPAERRTAEFNRLWWEKLNEEFRLETFSRNSLSFDYGDYIEQIAAGTVLGMFDKGSAFKIAEEILIEEELYERTYLPLALTFPGVEPNYLDAVEFTGGNGINFSNGISDPVRAIQYLDWIIDENVQRLLSWGIEGEHYYYDENGRIARPDLQRDFQNGSNWVHENLGRALLEMMPKMQGSYPSDNNPTSPELSPEEHFETLTGYDMDLFEKLGIYTMAGFWGEPKQRPVFYPYRGLEPEEESEAWVAENSIREILGGRMLINMVTAREGGFDALWETYVEAINEIDQNPLMSFFADEAAKRMP